MFKRLPVGLMTALGLLVTTAIPATAVAQSDEGGPSQLAKASKGGDLKVGIAIKRFQAKNDQTVAKGTATAQILDYAGHKTEIRQPVTLTAKRNGSCQILTLTLDELKLGLLGLNVDLSKVELTVTGRPHGGVLGSLFCKLARAKVKTSQARAARQLNAGLRRHPLRPLGFATTLMPGVVAAQTPTPTCQVLNLILGPLHLDLLGLVVDLNKVNLVITATPGAEHWATSFARWRNSPPESATSGRVSRPYISPR